MINNQYLESEYLRFVKATEFLDRRTGEFPTTRRNRLKQVFDDIMFALSLFLKLLRFVFLFIWPKSTNSKCQQTQHCKILEKVWPDDLYIFTDLKIRFEI